MVQATKVGMWWPWNEMKWLNLDLWAQKMIWIWSHGVLKKNQKCEWGHYHFLMGENVTT